MKGLLIYNREDYEKNNSFAKWIIDKGSERGLDITLVFSDEFRKEGINLRNVSFAINRSRSYEISLILELNDIKVYNNSRITLLGNNKLAAYRYAQSLGIAIPKILSDWSVDKESIVSKPIDGHGGVGVSLLNEVDISQGSFRLQQERVVDMVGDIRFYVIDNEIVYSVLRSSAKDGLRSNYSQGGSIELFEYNDTQRSLVHKMIDNIDASYIGIDFFLCHDGSLIFNEIEDVVGSRMLSELGINDTVDRFIELIAGDDNKG